MTESAWDVGVSVFSGRKDPSWRVSPEVAARIERAFDALPQLPDAPEGPSKLGYRGAFARGPFGGYTAYQGVAVRTAAAQRDARVDAGRAFERLLVSTAPHELWSEPWARELEKEGVAP